MTSSILGVKAAAHHFPSCQPIPRYHSNSADCCRRSSAWFCLKSTAAIELVLACGAVRCWTRWRKIEPASSAWKTLFRRGQIVGGPNADSKVKSLRHPHRIATGGYLDAALKSSLASDRCFPRPRRS
jgi:hypothetical protein